MKEPNYPAITIIAVLLVAAVLGAVKACGNKGTWSDIRLEPAVTETK